MRERRPIPFGSRVVDTADLDKGVTRLRQAGRAGLQVRVFRVTTRDGEQVARRLVNTVVARPPVDKITARGTRVDPPAPSGGGCVPNYTGSCVPISSDVDCAGGSGDGPAYVTGPVQVVGSDIYDLDADGDGTACD